MSALDLSAPASATAYRPNRADMRRHLEWLAEPVCCASPDLRVEIAWADPETGPNRAKTFQLEKLSDAVQFAAWINSKGCNVYVGATLKRADTPAKGRTRAEHAALATCLPVDVDGDFETGARKLGTVAKPQLLVLTGRTPEPRGQHDFATYGSKKAARQDNEAAYFRQSFDLNHNEPTSACLLV